MEQIRRIMIEVAYDGTQYHGWQFQNQIKTIEGELNAALSELFGEKIEVIGASRTDAGVHARGNVAVFDTTALIPAEKIPYAVNQKLPEDIRVVSGREVPLFFHPRKTLAVKTYEYRILISNFEDPMRRLYSYWTYNRLDMEKMYEAAQILVGTHDFAAFCAADSQALTTVRNIVSVNVKKNGDEVIITVVGNGFLYNMVRIIAGTLIEVGRGKMSVNDVETALENKDRTMAGPTAPAEGLTLVKYEFPELKYGLIGEKLVHSFSPEIHSIMGNPSYVLREIEPEKLDDYMKAKCFAGINVTIPYKENVIKYCDEVDETAMAIGSVNTIVNRDGKLWAYNTDYLGLKYMAERKKIEFREKKVVILGTGGTAKTALYVARLCGAASISVVSRDIKRIGDKNTKFFSDFARLLTYDELGDEFECNVLINTTPVGMFPSNDKDNIDISKLKNLESVIDVIYNPIRTGLILQAAEKRLKYTNGLPMLIAQAWYAERLFMGKSLDDELDKLENIIAEIERKFENIVFVGMPGAGKTTISELLSKRMKMENIDTDDEFTKENSISPEEYINKFGENAFRDAETITVVKSASIKGVIIATGGGSILRPGNRRALMQSGIIVYLKRSIDKLETKGRPLSTSLERLGELYTIRGPIYESMADIIVEVDDKTPKQVMAEVEEKIADFY